MDKLVIQGGRRLEGTVKISGAKNAALPAMTAALLTAEPVHLHNIPRVRDIVTMGRLLAHMDAIVTAPEIPSTTYTIRTESVNDAEAPYELVKTMRASVLTLGPLVGRFGRARVSLPGGCAIGARPVDLHRKRWNKWALRSPRKRDTSKRAFQKERGFTAVPWYLKKSPLPAPKMF
jgi:UDP-N-acetylglucosamine 1-carboxyvinyltransferase